VRVAAQQPHESTRYQQVSYLHLLHSLQPEELGDFLFPTGVDEVFAAQ
jgi:hypothetical protein